MDTEPAPEFTEKDKNGDWLTVSGPASLFQGFKTYAVKHFGKRGLSECTRDAIREYLMKRGVPLELDSADRERALLAKLDELKALGVNPEELLDRELRRLGQGLTVLQGGQAE